jgi:hypothetical protein
MVSLPNNFHQMLKGNLGNGIQNISVIIIAVIVIIVPFYGGGITI